jgi:hypothetical protein
MVGMPSLTILAYQSPSAQGRVRNSAKVTL